MGKQITTGVFASRDELVAMVMTLLRNGKPYSRIASICGISVSTVHSIYHMERRREALLTRGEN